MAAPSMNEKLLRQALNEKTAKSFGIAIGSFIALFILGHWTRHLLHQYRNGNRSPVMAAVIKLSRVALCNLAFVIFLSLKNTPLAILSASSYETLMPLHKAAGYTCIVASLVHAIVYLDAWAQADTLHEMLELEQIAGTMGGIALLLIGVSTLPYIRRRHYELFYAIHVILSAFILIVVALHRPKFSRSAIIITLFAASLSFMDRAIRFFKFSCNFMGNHAALTALPNGATRIVLRQSLKAAPGSHAFVWLPAIRFAETHPFTLVSSNPAEFVVQSRDGFTSALHQYAKDFPGNLLRCSLNAGYGKLPNFKTYDSILLIAGGSGASFTFAVALDLCRNPGPCPSGSITFVWVVRDQESLSWFHAELRELLIDPRITAMIHVTNNVESSTVVPLSGYSEKDSPITTEESSQTSLAMTTLSGLEKAIELEEMVTSKQPIDQEKAPVYAVGDISSSAIATIHGRPNIPALMESLLDNCDSTKRVIVGACGPEGLLEMVKSTESRCIRPDGPSFTLHTEGFGW
ncbi:hypothetical protein V496_02514 [Pseudogymnoascus sp. VKM F-4515 (FW-2607)]|nr:hypothetical protein V496_02514 [Pseudogymnoascus sp. VKM F-4515 (FW-2607)]KFY99944.1 hypothetical protein V498_00395 [Pseudogymnoascus sp. VKM F-4517 (FW-2822)]